MPAMKLSEMKNHIQKRKQQRYERARSRIEENFGKPEVQPKMPPESMIRQRVDYIEQPLPVVNNTSRVNGQYSNSLLLCKDNCDCSVYPDNRNPINLSLEVDPEIPLLESEFSSSPKFLEDSEEIVQHCLTETALPPQPAFLSEASNIYPCKPDTPPDTPLPAAVPELIDETLQKLLEGERTKVYSESGEETRLPFKKRRMSVSVNVKDAKEEISYPATPMISIAEVQALQNGKLMQNARQFKTPAERKEMPPLPVVYCGEVPGHFEGAYSGTSVSYHLNNVAMPFVNVPCNPFYTMTPVIMPFNNIQGYEKKMNGYTSTTGSGKKRGSRR